LTAHLVNIADFLASLSQPDIALKDIIVLQKVQLKYKLHAHQVHSLIILELWENPNAEYAHLDLTVLVLPSTLSLVQLQLMEIGLEFKALKLASNAQQGGVALYLA
jgi:hypothetical protein